MSSPQLSSIHTCIDPAPLLVHDEHPPRGTTRLEPPTDSQNRRRYGRHVYPRLPKAEAKSATDAAEISVVKLGHREHLGQVLLNGGSRDCGGGQPQMFLQAPSMQYPPDSSQSSSALQVGRHPVLTIKHSSTGPQLAQSVP